jgi:hypothetical protein
LDYEYILIYQLDSYVFKDDLNYWLTKKYSYVGAPWLESNCMYNFYDNYLPIGNGGFSLRKVDDFIKVLSSRKPAFPFLFCRRLEGRWYVINTWIRAFKAYFFLYRYNKLYRTAPINEDSIISILPVKFNTFYVPEINEALKFSFDSSPKIAFNLNKKCLPFGCHAWPRNDIEFWSQFIQY